MTQRVWLVAVGVILACSMGGLAQAVSVVEQGVTESNILIGQSAGVTGPVAGSVKEQIAGAQIYFDTINKHGGVFGRAISLKTLDDGFDAKRTLENADQLLKQDHVFGLFMVRGTPENESILPIVTSESVPLVDCND
jgi:ABC-type branched-subunit amino acid transport system substrate-binding protein